METTTITPTLPTVPARSLAAVRRYAGQWGLIAALAALPVYYGVHDLVYGYQVSVAGHQVLHHDLSNLGYDFAQGLSNGAIWALIAIGYTLVYGIIELINFAHGDVFMIGSFTAVGMWSVFGLTPGMGSAALTGFLLLTLVITMLVTGSLNVLIERVAYRPLRSAPKLAALITAVGFSFILQNVGLLWRGGSPQSVPDLIGVQQTVFTVGGVPIQRGYILVFAVMIPLVFALSWFINSTRAGRAMRATAQDPEAARLMGINVNATISLTFLLGGMLAGAAGPGVRAVRDQRVVLPGLQGRPDRVHGRGDGRHRQRPRRGARRAHHRRHPGPIRCTAGPAMDRGGGVRLPDRDHGPPPARAARRGDEGGRMSGQASGLWGRLEGLRAAAVARLPRWWNRALAGALIVFGIVLPFLFPPDSGFMNGTIIAVAYAVMSLGLNIVVGFAGLLDLGYVAFYALGAYSLGWFGSGFFFKLHIHVLVSPLESTLQGIHLNFVLILIAAALICALAGMLIGLPTLRLRGDYIAIVTLAFGEIIGTLAVNGQSIPVGGGMTLTAGNLGISAVDSPYFPGSGAFGLLDLRPWYWLIFGILLLVLFVNLRLRDSRLGRAWVALREDEVAAVSMGIPLVKTKLLAYSVGAAFGGMAGAFFGTYYTRSTPASSRSGSRSSSSRW